MAQIDDLNTAIAAIGIDLTGVSTDLTDLSNDVTEAVAALVAAAGSTPAPDLTAAINALKTADTSLQGIDSGMKNSVLALKAALTPSAPAPGTPPVSTPPVTSAP